MLADIKKELVEAPDKLISLLEHFGFANCINHGDKYISFGRDEEASKKSIVIRLQNNDRIYVKDYARNKNKEIFSYIIDEKNVTFSKILEEMKTILGIKGYYYHFENRNGGFFGGLFNNIKKKTDLIAEPIAESVLSEYARCGNKRFLRDFISLEVQKDFEIGYDSENQAITIPIRNQVGELIGVKERFNHDVRDGELKYWYSHPCSASLTLYGYSQNYEYLVNNVVYIFEAEKSVLQCASYGIRNCVALGSASVSKKQAQMIHEVNPKKIVLMHDEGIEKEIVIRNANMIREYSIFGKNMSIEWWNPELNIFDRYPSKVSPSDMGKEKFLAIISEEIELIDIEENSEIGEVLDI